MNIIFMMIDSALIGTCFALIGWMIWSKRGAPYGVIMAMTGVMLVLLAMTINRVLLGVKA